MRIISQTSQFKRDLKRASKGQYKAVLKSEFVQLVRRLGNDQPLAEKHRDHALTGKWIDHRDCHVKPDLVLVYRKPNSDSLQLVRLGTHSELEL
jgi:mRNA interferase YafQ